MGTYGTYIPGGLNHNESVSIQVTGSPAYTVIAFCYILILVYSLTLCFGAAIQAFFTYPETADKMLEEIEESFWKGGPRPWHTKPGGSLLDQKVLEMREHGRRNSPDVMETEGRLEYADTSDGAVV